MKTTCLYHEDGSRRKDGSSPSIEFNPRVQMPGCPTLDGTRMGVMWVAGFAWHNGLKQTLTSYPHIKRGDVLVACWWAGLYGTGLWKKRFGDWARMAANHLWYDCEGFADPPTKPT